MCSAAAAAAVKLLQSCPTLCDPIDSSPPGSPVPGILKERTLEWVAISFSNAWEWKVKVKSLSRVRLFLTPWTAAHQAPPSMGFSRQEYWIGLPFPSPKYVLRMQQKESNGDRSDLDRIFLQRKAFLKINAVFELIYFFMSLVSKKVLRDLMLIRSLINPWENISSLSVTQNQEKGWRWENTLNSHDIFLPTIIRLF